MTTLALFTGRRIRGTSLANQLTRLTDMGEQVVVLVPYSSLESMIGDVARSLHEKGVLFYTFDDHRCTQSEEMERPDFFVQLGCDDAIKLIEASQRILSWTY